MKFTDLVIRQLYLLSAYRFLLAAFPSTEGSWLNLHLSPFLHNPCLKNAQKTDFGSTPAIECFFDFGGFSTNSNGTYESLSTNSKINKLITCLDLLFEQ